MIHFAVLMTRELTGSVAMGRSVAERNTRIIVVFFCNYMFVLVVILGFVRTEGVDSPQGLLSWLDSEGDRHRLRSHQSAAFGPGVSRPCGTGL